MLAFQGLLSLQRYQQRRERYSGSSMSQASQATAWGLFLTAKASEHDEKQHEEE